MSIEITVPNLGESIVEATVGRWLKKVGDPVGPGDPVVELETEKVNMEVAAPDAGVLEAIAQEEGATVTVGDVLGRINEKVQAGAVASEQTPQPAASSTSSGSPEPTVEKEEVRVEGSSEPDGARATPTARRVAAEHGVDLRAVRGSGPSGRVTKDDVFAHLNRPPETHPTTSAPASAPKTSVAEGRREEIVRMSRRRQTIARRLVEAQQTAAMLTTFNQVDMSAIIEIRKRHREAFKARHGVGLGFMSFFTKSSVAALKEFPRLNAEVQGDEMILKYYYDIGIAVGTDEGLVVPVVRNADRLSFAEIEREVADLAQKARDGRLSLTELQGGTFTITNGGIYGSLFSTPILNSPQVGILGMHNIEERPMAINGEIVIRPMMYVALSYDHRIVDGSEAVRFLVRIKELLESPDLLLLED